MTLTAPLPRDPDRPSDNRPARQLENAPGTDGKVMLRPRHDCAVCYSPLVYWNGSYHHPGPSDHAPDAVAVPTLDTYRRPELECAYCAQPVTIHKGQPLHATQSDANCVGTPEAIKAWDA